MICTLNLDYYFAFIYVHENKNSRLVTKWNIFKGCITIIGMKVFFSAGVCKFIFILELKLKN